MIYMVMMYNVIPGMLANCALLINLFFTLGIMASFQSALSMPGIAGIVLTLGMAVDANVLIYERIKEELRKGKGMKEAVQGGYSNAFSAIFDSNLTSLITAIILGVIGTGPIRGFAITLGIGICCSFFTAVFLTRLVYEHQLNKGRWQNLKFFTGISKNLLQNTHFKFMSMYKKSFQELQVDYIDYLEYVPDGQDLPTEPSGIYRVEWDGETYYEISSPSQSTIHEKL